MIYVFQGLVPQKLPFNQSRKMHFVFWWANSTKKKSPWQMAR